MVSVKVVAFAGMTALLSSAASAADMPPPPMYLPKEEVGHGWYLRGDIGMSNQQVKRLHNVNYDIATSVNIVHKDFDSAPMFGLGVGYQWNHWLRFDLTGAYRGKANFHGFDILTSGGNTFTNEYRASKSEWLFLANVYADLGTWWNFTPFIGAGIGTSFNKISNFMDICTTCAGGCVAFAETATKWNFAWALHAGIAYQVNPNLTFEFAYRYVSLGDALSGDIVTYLGANNIHNPQHFRGITSHDLKFGVRWMIDTTPSYQPISLPPLMRKG